MSKKEEEEGLNEGAVVSVWYLGRGIAGEEGTFSPKAEEVGGCRRKRGCQPGFPRRPCSAVL